MRKFLRTILRILDGSPTTSMATHNRQRGQSLLELAFITPLLAILVAGASEIGWYANRWLSILEVTRVGARSATFLQDEMTPIRWNDDASIVPAIQTHPDLLNRDASDSRVLLATNARDCESGSGFGFYSFITCLMTSSMDPLEILVDGDDPLDADSEAQEAAEEALFPGPGGDLLSYDDIVVSVFAIQNINNADFTGSEVGNEGFFRPRYQTYENPPQPIDPVSGVYKITFDLNANSSKTYPPGMQSIVVGRYPSNANECNYKGTAANNKVLLEDTDPGFEYDPFDYIDNPSLDTAVGDVTIVKYDADDDAPSFQIELADLEDESLADLMTGGNGEFQRGFSLTGQHKVNDPDLFCFGSEFSVADVEALINMPGFIEPDLYDPPADDSSAEYLAWEDAVYASQNERMFFEPQGMTLVEVFWQHELLLNFPLFRPFQEAYGDGEGTIVIALWSAFPLPSIAPNFTYQLP